MIAYIGCISPKPGEECWKRIYYEDEDELLPLPIHKPNNLQIKDGSSLRRRLLTATIHHQQDGLWPSRQWDGPPAHKTTQPLQKQQSSTFKSMHRDFTAVSSLDEESKWSVHYTAPWHQQENVFLPGSRPPCVEELHCQAKVNLRTVLRECDKLRKDGFRSSHYYSQDPTVSSPLLPPPGNRRQDQDKKEKKKKSSETSAEEEKLVYSFRPQTPLLDNISDINSLNSWSKCLPLPTPEEKMRQQAETVTTDIIPINITGENFDRQASFRRAISNTDTIIRRSKRVKRRKTITGVPDNIKRELANNERTAIRTQSICTTGQCSTLSHIGKSSLKHLVTRDSVCQTDDIKIVQPSMRRIRSQRGHGIANQMANLSLSSSSSISNTSDCNGNICTHQLDASDQAFHSLPRQGARICLPKLEANCSSSSYLTVSGSTVSLPYQVTMQHTSPDSTRPVQHMSSLRNNTSVNSTSSEFHAFQNECLNVTSGYMFSSNNSSTSSLNAGVVLQNVRNLSSVHSLQSLDTEETQQSPMSTCPSDQPFSSSGASCSISSSCCQSPASLCSTLNERNCSPSGVCDDSDMSECSIHSGSTLITDHWMYKPALMEQCTSSCSSPIRNICNSLEHSPKKTDDSSLFSVHMEGCHTSIHLAPDCKPFSHGWINKAENTRYNLHKYMELHSPDDSTSLHSNHSLTNSISLRKAKKPPLPPKRTDSLHRKPHRKPYHDEKLLNVQLISSLQESLKSASFSGQMPFSELDDLWTLGTRSQSSVSVSSSGMSAPAAMCPTTPTHSDSSSQHTEYIESWDFQRDFPQSSSEHVSSSQIIRPILTRDSDNNGIPFKTGINSKMATSPDKVQLMTSPSSGYSSQSITPNAGTPVTSLLRTRTLAGRPKPKVPERKSSLRSSSSTPLSSNSSDSVKSLPDPPPLPKTLPGLVPLQSSSASPMPIFVMSNGSPVTPVLLPQAITSTPKEKQRFLPVAVTTPEECKKSISVSPDSGPTTPEVSSPLKLTENNINPLPFSPPPPLPLSSNPTQPVTQGVSNLKATNSPISLYTMETGKELNSGQSDKPSRHERPVITAQALQRVQLRPVKLIKLENIFTDIITTVCGPENKEPRTSTNKSLETEIVKNVFTPDSVYPIQNVPGTTDDPSKESTPVRQVFNHTDCDFPVSNAQSSDSVLELSLNPGPLSTTSAYSNILQTTATPCNGILQDQRSPESPKMSSDSLIMAPVLQQHALNGLEVTGSAMPLEPETLNPRSLTDIDNQHEIPLQPEFEVENDSQDSTPGSPRRHSQSSGISSDSLSDPQLTGLMLSDQEIGLCDTDLGLNDKDFVLSDDKDITDDSLSCSSGSVIFKDEENYENDTVFDSGTDSSSPTFSSTGEDIEEMLTPERPRTTDDLFAAIHRSKRKVLGRCESEEESSHSFFSSPLITPTSSIPSMTWMPRQSSYIQRKLRRSTTSNDSFKALLLMKGSRSEPGFRMSAMERLKCSDPRLQRSNAEASSPFSDQCTSPGRSRRVTEEWARTEGALPRLSPSLTHSKYGRSSTPPCSASSRYNCRNRIPSGPMTVICEREGELTESIDCCNLPFPVSLSSSGTVCAQGST